jgi:hypothetical protein
MRAYCYEIEKVDIQEGKILTNVCPYFTKVVIKGIYISFCLKLGKGDLSDLTDSEHKIIEKSLSKSIIEESFSLDLLHDGVAECN